MVIEKFIGQEILQDETGNTAYKNENYKITGHVTFIYF